MANGLTCVAKGDHLKFTVTTPLDDGAWNPTIDLWDDSTFEVIQTTEGQTTHPIEITHIFESSGNFSISISDPDATQQREFVLSVERL